MQDYIDPFILKMKVHPWKVSLSLSYLATPTHSSISLKAYLLLILSIHNNMGHCCAYAQNLSSNNDKCIEELGSSLSSCVFSGSYYSLDKYLDIRIKYGIYFPGDLILLSEKLE